MTSFKSFSFNKFLGNGTAQFSSTPFSSPSSLSFGTTKPPEQEKVDSTKVEASKPNPFASFSFGNSPTATASAVPTQSSLTTTTSKPLFSSLFSGIGQSAPVAPTEKKDDTAVANVSGTSAKDDEDDEYVPTAHFEPVISLPDLVEVKTGEENERIAFEHRAKLLRFVKESKEWKERGIGNMKVLVNIDDPNKVRLLMRREQVHKLCCNQFITKDTQFKKLPNTETALSWYGQDYSENELQIELLAIRFKTAELCKQFHDAILEVQKDMTAGDQSVPPKEKAIDKKLSQKGFGDQFKPKAGSWNCDSCYVSNKGEDKKCAACGTSKDKNATADEAKAPASKPQFSFGVQSAAKANDKVAAKPAAQMASGFGDQFKPKAGSWSCKSCYTSNTAEAVYCICCEEPKDETIPKRQPQSKFGSTTATTKFTFGFQSNTPATNTSTATTTAASSIFGTATSTPSGGFQFGTLSKPVEIPKIESKEFGFVFKAKSPGNPKSPVKTYPDGIEDVSDDENVEEEENNTYFTPVIPLPDKIEVKTGEEDETVLYSHRAKLYRFKDSEWKERGLGDVKILQHKSTGKMR